MAGRAGVSRNSTITFVLRSPGLATGRLHRLESQHPLGGHTGQRPSAVQRTSSSPWRRISVPAFLTAIENSPRAALIHAALLRDPRGAFTTIALLRLSPVVPFALVGVVLAAACIRTSAFLVGTAVGVVPRTRFVAYAGSELAAFDPAAGAVKLGIAIVASVVLFLWIGFAARRALRRRLDVPAS